MTFETSDRFKNLPPYPLAHIPALRRRLKAEGVDLIDLGAGDADLDPPPAVVRRLAEAAGERALSRYPFQVGLVALREAIAAWMRERFGVSLDPHEELLPLIGSKDGIAHLPLAFMNPGDVAVIPDPGYQAYRGGVVLAGGTPHAVPLLQENDFLIPLDGLVESLSGPLRLLYLNYPNNPTAAVAPFEYFQDAVALCRREGAILIHDHAYSELAFDGYRPPSVLEVDGALGQCIEYHSFSKTYNMTGWRLGWAAGSAELIAALARVKTFVDTGVYMGVQAAGVAALESYSDWVPGNVELFRSRRDAAFEALRDAGFDVRLPQATMYLWVPVPGGESSVAFSQRVLEQEGVIVLPGGALGAGGEGFFRIALTVREERLAEAAERLGRCLA
ncbi:MAG: LL-diaminopimelate aminotransferase [Gemmatimonadota bacterium]|nr:MAG: LL-diaminopimelate aminotransferase [Gemmatimonadota bacterium]